MKKSTILLIIGWVFLITEIIFLYLTKISILGTISLILALICFIAALIRDCNQRPKCSCYRKPEKNTS